MDKIINRKQMRLRLYKGAMGIHQLGPIYYFMPGNGTVYRLSCTEVACEYLDNDSPMSGRFLVSYWTSNTAKTVLLQGGDLHPDYLGKKLSIGCADAACVTYWLGATYPNFFTAIGLEDIFAL